MNLTGWIPPVCDRSEEDVKYAANILGMSWSEMSSVQRTKYMSGLKGCMNRIDFERIENNVGILLNEINVDFAEEDLPVFLTEEYFDDLRGRIVTLREGYPIHEDTPSVPELPFNTWQKFNAIEKILSDIYEVATAQFKHYAGNEIYAGESVGLLL